MSQTQSAPAFQFTGGHLCLDFANTVDNRTSLQPVDSLTGFDDLLAWVQQAGIVSPAGAAQMKKAARFGLDADSVFHRGVSLREAIYLIFSAVAAGKQPPMDAIEKLNRILRDSASFRVLVSENRQFRWRWLVPTGHLEWILWPIALDAAQLLTSDLVPRVRECSLETCGWLFLDRSKSHNRRWCDMKSCGNRYKARRHYERIKSA